MCHYLLHGIGYLFLIWCFFFFKQKTAYEMRISDWSSDVCSSDLPENIDLRPDPSEPIFCHPSGQPIKDYKHSFLSLLNYAGVPEIGRASCRERVCQYV